ncbi:MAG: hypothetical protein QOE16_1060 [Microbacteriaceae bacterium]|jgi:uncharacterized protein (DUF305 family)|nr:hypothetical protein [Microbacteriaceae bacterium]
MKIASRLALTGVVLAAGGLLAGCTATAGMGNMPGMSHSSSTPAAAHNAADVMFAQMMLVHHEGAIAMANLAPSRAASPQVKALATAIKAAQQPEIIEMTAWLKAWGAPTSMPGSTPAPSMSTMPGMDMSTPTPTDSTGMGTMPGMTPQDMASLQAASGAAFDTLFLSLMIQHHQGAVTMAKQEQSGGMDSAAKKLADSIVTSQTKQISDMQAMLTSLG